MSNSWVSYGDINPIEHGGVWERQLHTNSDKEFTVVTIDTVEDCDDETWLITVSYIDLDDAWIDIKAVKASRGSAGEVHVYDINASDVVGYYGAYQCGGSSELLTSEADVLEQLEAYGIKF